MQYPFPRCELRRYLNLSTQSHSAILDYNLQLLSTRTTSDHQNLLAANSGPLTGVGRL